VTALKLPPSFLGQGCIPLQASVNKLKALQKRETEVLYKTTRSTAKITQRRRYTEGWRNDTRENLNSRKNAGPSATSTAHKLTWNRTRVPSVTGRTVALADVTTWGHTTNIRRWSRTRESTTAGGSVKKKA